MCRCSYRFDCVPLGLSLLLLMGVAPLLPWRRASWESVRRTFRIPAGVGLPAGLALALGDLHYVPVLVSVRLCSAGALAAAVDGGGAAAAVAAGILGERPAHLPDSRGGGVAGGAGAGAGRPPLCAGARIGSIVFRWGSRCCC